ncbi:MAG: sulfite exporter TauE/SafE family protein [Methanomassiliicoccales archaeon]
MDSLVILPGVFAAAFICEFVNVTLGMGYGTTLTPLLLIVGFAPLAVIPSILLAGFLSGALASVLHDRAGNVDFDFRNDPEHQMVKRLGKLGYMPRSKDSKVALVLGACSLVGAIVAVMVAVNIPVLYLKLFIGLLVLAMGIILLCKCRARSRFSWGRLVAIGSVAAFNKGMSGGGYGPLVTSGQILSGIRSKNSVAISAFSESLTCLVGVIAYLAIGGAVDWSLSPVLVSGTLLSVPLATYSVKRMPERSFTMLIGAATTVLGAATLYNTLM